MHAWVRIYAHIVAHASGTLSTFPFSEDYINLPYHSYTRSLNLIFRLFAAFMIILHKCCHSAAENSSCDPCRRSKWCCFFSSPRIGDWCSLHPLQASRARLYIWFGDLQLEKKRSKLARTREITSDSAAETSGLASGDFQADVVAGHGALALWLDSDYLERHNECLDLPELFFLFCTWCCNNNRDFWGPASWTAKHAIYHWQSVG